MGLLIHPEHQIDGWPFDDPPGTACATTLSVMEDGEPILAVGHFADGDWLFQGAARDDSDEGTMVCIGCLFERCPEIAEHATLPLGHKARRADPRSKWVISPMAAE